MKEKEWEVIKDVIGGIKDYIKKEEIKELINDVEEYVEKNVNKENVNVIEEFEIILRKDIKDMN